MRRLPDGTIFTSSLSRASSRTIFAASECTSAAWSFDMAPLTIWLFRRASGPTRNTSRMAAISAVLPFFLAIDRMARFVITLLSRTARMKSFWNFSSFIGCPTSLPSGTRT